MKIVYFFVAFFLFFQGLVGQEFLAKTSRLETFVDCCEAGIIEIHEGKIHIQSNRFSQVQNELMFLSDTLEWIPMNESLKDILGIASIDDYREECRISQRCLKQHVGFFWSPKWNLWFCLNECPYNFYNNFLNGKGE